MELNLFLPQMRLSFDDLVARARAAEAAGFVGMTGMDHLVPPMANRQPMYEAMITTAWLAAHTERLRLGTLVLCDAFRHPAVLAREVVSLDHASRGRYELGIGWGSVPWELDVFGVASTDPATRVARLRETLEVLRALWSGEEVDYEGGFHRIKGVQQQPVPLGPLPIVIGGTGPKTLALVRDFADWWNVHVGKLHLVEQLRDQVGEARVSIQQMIAFVPEGADRDAVAEVAHRRFPYSDPVLGTAEELVDHFRGLEAQGVERVYTWFCDFAPPDVLTELGETVIPHL